MQWSPCGEKPVCFLLDFITLLMFSPFETHVPAGYCEPTSIRPSLPFLQLLLFLARPCSLLAHAEQVFLVFLIQTFCFLSVYGPSLPPHPHMNHHSKYFLNLISISLTNCCFLLSAGHSCLFSSCRLYSPHMSSWS